MKRNTQVIAEIAQSYEGDFDTLKKIIDKLGKSHVDMVMFQVVKADELATKDNNNYKFFKTLEFKEEELNEVISQIKKFNKKPIAEVFGLDTALLMQSLGVDGFKIHPADVSNLEFLTKISQLNLPIYLGIGGCTEDEIEKAIDRILSSGNEQLTLMHGYQTGPTKIEDSHLKKISYLKDKFSLEVGYSDHCPGSVDAEEFLLDQSALYFPALAISEGATVIEKHVILDRTKKWEDFESALTPSELDKFIDFISKVELSFGDKNILMNEQEEDYRLTSKKFLVAKKDLKLGHVLQPSDISFKRIKDPSLGLINLEEVEGKILREDLMQDQPITMNLIYEKS